MSHYLFIAREKKQLIKNKINKQQQTNTRESRTWHWQSYKYLLQFSLFETKHFNEELSDSLCSRCRIFCWHWAQGRARCLMLKKIMLSKASLGRILLTSCLSLQICCCFYFKETSKNFQNFFMFSINEVPLGILLQFCPERTYAM